MPNSQNDNHQNQHYYEDHASNSFNRQRALFAFFSWTRGKTALYFSGWRFRRLDDPITITTDKPSTSNICCLARTFGTFSRILRYRGSLRNYRQRCLRVFGQYRRGLGALWRRNVHLSFLWCRTEFVENPVTFATYEFATDIFCCRTALGARIVTHIFTLDARRVIVVTGYS